MRNDLLTLLFQKELHFYFFCSGKPHFATILDTGFEAASQQVKTIFALELLTTQKIEIRIQSRKKPRSVQALPKLQKATLGSQRTSRSKKEATVQVQVKIKDGELMLTAFSNILQELLKAHPTDVSIESDIEQIEDAHLDLENITFN